MNDLNASAVPIVSIDIPSGLSADTASLIGKSIVAKLTVALGAPKIPLLMLPAAERVGKVVVADIGIPDFVTDSIVGPSVKVITRAWARTLVAPRRAGMHKGDCGRVLLVAGSPGKTGAACLAGRGALRSGAGFAAFDFGLFSSILRPIPDTVWRNFRALASSNWPQSNLASVIEHLTMIAAKSSSVIAADDTAPAPPVRRASPGLPPPARAPDSDDEDEEA